MKSGIYQIRNLLNNKVYIGSTKNFDIRWLHHLRNLRNGKHCNVKLQRSFNKYSEHNFIFEILEEYAYDKEIMLREQYWIDKFDSKKKGYNIADASFGDILSAHPEREQIKENISKGLKKTYNSLSETERKTKYGKSADANGMYGKKHSLESKRKISENMKKIKIRDGVGATAGISKTTEHRIKMSENAKKRVGSKNSFYGKKHSEQTKKKLSEKRLNVTPSNAKKISVNGIIYLHRRIASEKTGINQNTLSWRAKSKNYPEIFYIN